MCVCVCVCVLKLQRQVVPNFRAVQGPARPDPRFGTDRIRSSTDRTNFSDGRQQISFSKNRDQRVGYRISSSQIQETQTDQPICIFRRILGFFWEDLARFGKISLDLVEILPKIAEISLDLGRFAIFSCQILVVFHLSSLDSCYFPDFSTSTDPPDIHFSFG